MLPLVAAAAKLIGSASVRTIARRLGAKFVDKTKKEILEAISKAQTKKARDAIRGASKVKAKDPKGDIAKGVRAGRAQAGQFSKDNKGLFSIKPKERKALGSRVTVGDKAKNKQRATRTKINPLRPKEKDIQFKKDTKGEYSIKPKKRKALGSRDVVGDKAKNQQRSMRTKTNALRPDKKKQKAAEMEKRQREMADKSNKRKAERKAKSRALTVIKDPKKSTTQKETATATTSKKKSRVTSFKDYVRKNPKKTAAGVIGGAAAVGYVATRGKKKGNTPVKSNGSSSSNNSHIRKSTPNRIGKPKKYNYMGRMGGIRVGVRKK